MKSVNPITALISSMTPAIFRDDAKKPTYQVDDFEQFQPDYNEITQYQPEQPPYPILNNYHPVKHQTSINNYGSAQEQKPTKQHSQGELDSHYPTKQFTYGELDTYGSPEPHYPTKQLTYGEIDTYGSPEPHYPTKQKNHGELDSYGSPEPRYPTKQLNYGELDTYGSPEPHYPTKQQNHGELDNYGSPEPHYPTKQHNHGGLETYGIPKQHYPEKQYNHGPIDTYGSPAPQYPRKQHKYMDMDTYGSPEPHFPTRQHDNVDIDNYGSPHYSKQENHQEGFINYKDESKLQPTVESQQYTNHHPFRIDTYESPHRPLYTSSRSPASQSDIENYGSPHGPILQTYKQQATQTQYGQKYQGRNSYPYSNIAGGVENHGSSLEIESTRNNVEPEDQLQSKINVPANDPTDPKFSGADILITTEETFHYTQEDLEGFIESEYNEQHTTKKEDAHAKEETTKFEDKIDKEINVSPKNIKDSQDIETRHDFENIVENKEDIENRLNIDLKEETSSTAEKGNHVIDSKESKKEVETAEIIETATIRVGTEEKDIEERKEKEATSDVKNTKNTEVVEDTESTKHIEDKEEIKQDNAEDETAYKEVIEDDEVTFFNMNSNSSKDLKENENKNVDHIEKTDQIGETDHKVGNEDILSEENISDFEEAQERNNILDSDLKDLKEDTKSTTEKGNNGIDSIESNKEAEKAETIETATIRDDTEEKDIKERKDKEAAIDVKDTKDTEAVEDTESIKHIEDTEEIDQDNAKEEAAYIEAIEDGLTFSNMNINSTKDIEETEKVDHREKTEETGEPDHNEGKEVILSKENKPDFEKARDGTNIHNSDDIQEMVKTKNHESMKNVRDSVDTDDQVFDKTENLKEYSKSSGGIEEANPEVEDIQNMDKHMEESQRVEENSMVEVEDGKISKLQKESPQKTIPNINILNGLGAPSYDLQPSAHEPDQNNPDKYFNMDWDKLEDVLKNNIWYTNGNK